MEEVYIYKEICIHFSVFSKLEIEKFHIGTHVCIAIIFTLSWSFILISAVYNQSFFCSCTVFIRSMNKWWVHWKVTIIFCLICYFMFPQNRDIWAFLTNVSNRLRISALWLGLVSYLFYRFILLLWGINLP